MITVAELIKQLQEFPQDCRVYFKRNKTITSNNLHRVENARLVRYHESKNPAFVVIHEETE